MKRFHFSDHILLGFFILLFAAPVIWLLKPPVPEIYSYVEGRKLEDFPTVPQPRLKTVIKRFVQLKPAAGIELLFNGFLDRAFQTQFEKAVSDQFPLRINAIQTAKAIDRGVIQSAYVFLPDSAIPADMHTGLLVTRGNTPSLLFAPEPFTNNLTPLIDIRVQNYANLVSNYPDIRFYIFHMQRLQNSPFHPLNAYYPDADEGQALEYFESHIPTGLSYSGFRLSGFEDHSKYYYASDHHLNLEGVAKTYQGLYSQLKTHFPGMSPVLDLTSVIEFDGVTFKGSLARASFYPIEGDRFAVFDLATPTVTVYANNKEIPFFENQRNLIQAYSRIPYDGYYDLYYDLQNAIYDFEYQVDNLRGLLIIGSSFVRPIVPLIASHYRHTYYVDLRQQPDFSFEQFIAAYPVDDVVIFGDNPVTFTDPAWMINP